MSKYYLEIKWLNKLQDYCNYKCIKSGSMKGDFTCGNMNYCKFCNLSRLNPCAMAICKYLKSVDYNIDYLNYNFSDLIKFIQKK